MEKGEAVSDKTADFCRTGPIELKSGIERSRYRFTFSGPCPAAYGLLDLLKKRHDPIDDCGEGTAGILSCFDEITTLLGMLHERYKLTGFIFIDQYGSVTATAGS
jgi:hypothetical protein